MLADELHGAAPERVGLVLGGAPRAEALMRDGGGRPDLVMTCTSATAATAS